MKRYLLDTNTVSHLLKAHLVVARHLAAVPITSISISAITEGELLYGLARRPEAKRLHLAVREFLCRVDVLPWDHDVAEHYGRVHAAMTAEGKVLAPLDLLIASHALATSTVLVSNDRAFAQVPALPVEDWTV